MKAEACPECNMPFMGDRKTGSMLCCECDPMLAYLISQGNNLVKEGNNLTIRDADGVKIVLKVGRDMQIKEPKKEAAKMEEPKESSA